MKHDITLHFFAADYAAKGGKKTKCRQASVRSKKELIDVARLTADYFAKGGKITKCPPATVVSKYDRRFKGVGVVRGGARLFLGI